MYDIESSSVVILFVLGKMLSYLIVCIYRSRTCRNRIPIFVLSLICMVRSCMIVAARPGLERFPCQGPPPQPFLRAEEQEECLQVVVRGRMPQAAVHWQGPEQPLPTEFQSLRVQRVQLEMNMQSIMQRYRQVGSGWIVFLTQYSKMRTDWCERHVFRLDCEQSHWRVYYSLK
jgi:hypothetical protein